jgi:hypothetical protein
MLSSFEPTFNLPSPFSPPGNRASFERLGRKNKPLLQLTVITFEVVSCYAFNLPIEAVGELGGGFERFYPVFRMYPSSVTFRVF